MGDWDDVEKELNSGGGKFFKPGKLEPGESVEVEVVRYTKWVDTKYPIKNKDGVSLGYTWRFFLRDGSVWDVSNQNRKILLQGLHPNGKGDAMPCKFRVTNIGKVINKQPSTKVEILGGNVTESADVPF